MRRWRVDVGVEDAQLAEKGNTEVTDYPGKAVIGCSHATQTLQITVRLALLTSHIEWGLNF